MPKYTFTTALLGMWAGSIATPILQKLNITTTIPAYYLCLSAIYVAAIIVAVILKK